MHKFDASFRRKFQLQFLLDIRRTYRLSTSFEVGQCVLLSLGISVIAQEAVMLINLTNELDAGICTKSLVVTIECEIAVDIFYFFRFLRPFELTKRHFAI